MNCYNSDSIDFRFTITVAAAACNTISTLFLLDRTLHDAGDEEQGMFHRDWHFNTACTLCVMPFTRLPYHSKFSSISWLSHSMVPIHRWTA